MEKPDEAFAWRDKGKGLKHPSCKECHKLYNSNWYSRSEERKAATKARALQRKHEIGQFLYDKLVESGGCACGETDPACLEFDHVRGNKSFSMCQAANKGVGQERLEAELAKCEVRCSNCHKKKTAKEQGWYEKFRD